MCVYDREKAGVKKSDAIYLAYRQFVVHVKGSLTSYTQLEKQLLTLTATLTSYHTLIYYIVCTVAYMAPVQ